MSYFSEPLLVPFYTSLNADISGIRKDIKKRSMIFFPLFPVFSYKKISKFSFQIYLFDTYLNINEDVYCYCIVTSFFITKGLCSLKKFSG